MKVLPPNRLTQTFLKGLPAAAKQVFPLLCPVREAEWIDGWDPIGVFSSSGKAERDCVFVTRADPGNAVWVITEHDPRDLRLKILKVIPAHAVVEIVIQLQRKGVNASEEANRLPDNWLSPMAFDRRETHHGRLHRSRRPQATVSDATAKGAWWNC